MATRIRLAIGQSLVVSEQRFYCLTTSLLSLSSTRLLDGRIFRRGIFTVDHKNTQLTVVLFFMTTSLSLQG